MKPNSNPTEKSSTCLIRPKWEVNPKPASTGNVEKKEKNVETKDVFSFFRKNREYDFFFNKTEDFSKMSLDGHFLKVLERRRKLEMLW